MAAVICGFCKAEMDESAAERKSFGGREVLYCPKCKGPCRPKDDKPVSEPSPPPIPARLPPHPPDLAKRGLRAPSPPLKQEPSAPAAASGPDELLSSAMRAKLSLRGGPPMTAPSLGSAPALVSATPPPGTEKKSLPPPKERKAQPLSATEVEIVNRLKTKSEADQQRRDRRKARLNHNPWSAFWFPFKPLSFMAILLMLVIFSGQDLLMDIGLLGDDDDALTAATPPAPPPPKPAARAGKKPPDVRPPRVPPAARPPPAPEAKLQVGRWYEQYAAAGPYAGRSEGGGLSFLFPALLGLGATGLMLKAFLGMYFSALLLTIIYETANGTESFPRWPNPLDILDSFLIPALHFLFCVLVAVGPALLALLLPFLAPELLRPLWLAAPFLLLLGMVYLPISLMCVAMLGEASGALPRTVLPALAKAHVHYLPALLAFLVLTAWPLISALWLAPRLKSWQLILAGYAAHFILLVVAMRALGILFRVIEHKLKWNQFARA